MIRPEAQAPGTKAPSADPTREYVVGTGFWSSRIGQVLSHFFDDAELVVGPDTYERMAQDPVVAKNLKYQTLSVTSERMQFLPAVSEKDDRYELAVEIAEFCRRCANNLHRPIMNIVREMMAALKRAHTVAEITYRDPVPTGRDAYKLTLKSIKVKPRNTTAFVVDPFLNVEGLTAWNYGASGLVSSDKLDEGQKVIPREKFAVLAFETEDEDPRGRHVMRPGVNFWQAKCLVPGLNLKWLEKSGIQSVIGFTAQDAGNEQEYIDGKPVYDTEGNANVQSPQEAMADRLASLESASSAAFPYGAEVKALEVGGDGSQFTRAYSDFDQQLDYALSLQSGATKDGKHGNRSAKEILKDVFDVLIWSRKHDVAQVFETDVFKPLTIYNFGEENADLAPRVQIGDEEGKDWAIDAVAAAELGPYLTDSQWIKLCMEIGIEPPEDGEVLPPRVKSVKPPAKDGKAPDDNTDPEGGDKKNASR